MVVKRRCWIRVVNWRRSLYFLGRLGGDATRWRSILFEEGKSDVFELLQNMYIICMIYESLQTANSLKNKELLTKNCTGDKRKSMSCKKWTMVGYETVYTSTMALYSFIIWLHAVEIYNLLTKNWLKLITKSL